MRKVLIVDDHALVASALTGALEAQGYTARACPTLDDEMIRATLTEFRPAVVLLDLELGPDRSGKALIPAALATGAGVVMLTASTNMPRLAECIEAGAGGLLSKSAAIDEVVATIEAVAERGSAFSDEQRDVFVQGLQRHRDSLQAEREPFMKLTAREQQVLGALIEGKTAQTVADETFTSIRTVRGHIQGVLDKLGVSSQLAAVAKAKDVGWRPRQRPDT